MTNAERFQTTKGVIYCGHCGASAVMFVLCQKRITTSIPENDPVSSMWQGWQILRCSTCAGITALESYSIADEDEEWADEFGQERVTEVIHRNILYPLSDEKLPRPNPNMPVAVLEDYEEARRVFLISARSAAALLRLGLQKLCKELGEKGEHIDADIASLVRKGLPIHIQQALDIVRVIGNEAVHPGEINVRDNPVVARQLFDLINEIVDNRIGQIKRQGEISKLYNTLPESKLKYIERRDQKKE